MKQQPAGGLEGLDGAADDTEPSDGDFTLSTHDSRPAACQVYLLHTILTKHLQLIYLIKI